MRDAKKMYDSQDEDEEGVKTGAQSLHIDLKRPSFFVVFWRIPSSCTLAVRVERMT